MIKGKRYLVFWYLIKNQMASSKPLPGTFNSFRKYFRVWCKFRHLHKSIISYLYRILFFRCARNFSLSSLPCAFVGLSILLLLAFTLKNISVLPPFKYLFCFKIIISLKLAKGGILMILIRSLLRSIVFLPISCPPFSF